MESALEFAQVSGVFDGATVMLHNGQRVAENLGQNSRKRLLIHERAAPLAVLRGGQPSAYHCNYIEITRENPKSIHDIFPQIVKSPNKEGIYMLAHECPFVAAYKASACSRV